MKTVDLSGFDTVRVQVGPYIYVVDAGTKMAIADYLDSIKCPQVSGEEVAKERVETFRD